MNFRNLVLSLALSLGVMCAGSVSAREANLSVSELSQAVNADYILHTVAKGETVYSIATSYKISEEDIYRINPSARQGIKIGQDLLLPNPKIAPTRYVEHTISSKETLYGVSKTYAVTVQDLKDANKGLTEETFKVGNKIRIPVFDSKNKVRTMVASEAPHLTATHTKHVVGKRETLYGISKTWNVSIDEILESNPIVKLEGLKDGMTIYLPKRGANNIMGVYPSQAKIKIGVFLPFLKDNGVVSRQKIVEYYEGFLLSLQEMKAKGLDADVFTFDIGDANSTTRLESILETTEAKSLTMIIGGVSEKQIGIISKFAKERQVKYIVPFGSVDRELEVNPYIYQATNSHSNLYWKVADTFKSTFPASEYNIVFVSEAGEAGDKIDFVDVLKKTLVRSQISFRNVTMSFEATADFTSALDNSRKNVIVPTSSSEGTLRKIMSLMEYAKRSNITLFGYPDWQIYTSFNRRYHKYNTYIYSMFYFDNKQEKVKEFETEYHKWYGKKLVNSYPKYAHLGYDMGLYFLTALNRYGNTFDAQVNNMIVPSIQSAIHYIKVGEAGGHVNNGLYFIHYKTDSTIEKIDCNR